jgi:ribosomal protein S18 acetylase RimI-like enzyme
MKIIELKKDQYKGYELEYYYTSSAYYDVSIKKKKSITIQIKRKKTFKKIEKRSKGKLFEDYIGNGEAYGVFDGKKLIACIEGSLETWNNRYRIWNFVVDKKYRKEGFGRMLFEHMLKIAEEKKARALILEVQSCNDVAIKFYIKFGLHFVGLNTIEYSNNDIENKEVRLEMAKRILS